MPTIKLIGTAAPPFILLIYTITIFSLLIDLFREYKSRLNVVQEVARKVKVPFILGRGKILLDVVIWIGVGYTLSIHLFCLGRVTFCTSPLYDKIILILLWNLPFLVMFFFLLRFIIRTTRIPQIQEFLEEE